MPSEIAWCENPSHAHKESSCEARRAPLWLLHFHPIAIRARVRDWLWLRRHRRGYFGDYVVELGGQRFTQAQWEAVQAQFDGPPCTCPDPKIAARSGHVSKCGAA